MSFELIVRDMQVNFQKCPLGINPQKVFFSWGLESEKRGEKQSAYRIIISQKQEKVLRGIGDIWDSGKVLSSNSISIPYKGEKLDSNERFYWAVQLWDSQGHCGTVDEVSYFDTGPCKGDWTAKWIWRPGEIVINDFVQFRKIFALDSAVKLAKIHVSAHNFFHLFVNGSKVGGYGSPAPSHPQKSKFYLSYDITSLLKQGSNSICAVVHYLGGSGQNYVDGLPGFIVQGEIQDSNGSIISLATDETWKVNSDTPYMRGTPYQQNRRISAVERFNAAKDDPGWLFGDFDDSKWENAIISGIQEEKWNLKPQEIPEGIVSSTIQPVVCGVQQKGCQVFDAGKVITGWVALELEGIPGVTVRTRYSENLDGDGRVGHNVCNEKSEHYYDEYTMKGEGKESWAADFSYKAFRYVEVEGYPHMIDAESIKICNAHTGMSVEGDFKCSNDLLNEIFKSCIQTQKNNTTGQLVDCPHREQAQYLADSDLQAETFTYFFSEPNVVEKVLSDFQDSQLEDGTFPFVFPSNYEHPEFNIKIPEWDLHYVTLLWKAYYTYGDAAILERYYESARKMLMYYIETLDGTTGLIPKDKEWHISDWPYPNINQEGPFLTVQNCKIYHDLNLMAKIALYLKRKEDYEEYLKIADGLKEAIQEHLYNCENKLFRDSYGIDEYHQGTNVVAFHYGLVPAPAREQLLNWIVNQGLDTKTLLSLNLLKVLFENGKQQEAYDLINRTDYPGWGHMVSKGYKTIWEGFDDKESHSHAWNGYPAKIFAEYLLGISALEPGFKKIAIRPFIPKDLTWAEGSVWTVRGKVYVRWKKELRQIKMQIQIPTNTMAEMYIPKIGNGNMTIREGGQLLFNEDGFIEHDKEISYLGEDADSIVLGLESGKYCFTSKLLHR